MPESEVPTEEIKGEDDYDEEEEEVEIYVTSKEVLYDLADDFGHKYGHKYGNRTPSPLGTLNNRAWIVQERLLSPRTLYYGGRTIH